MSILVDRNTKVITQGTTGDTGTFRTGQALALGTQELLAACKGIDGNLK
jgi:succinyl-CoA synthetase alpha subunit